MKKKLLLLQCLLSLLIIAKAQDFKPGTEALGYLEQKNVVVDYSTGIFHYQVPLFMLGTGNFNLPISLSYIGRGVKVRDIPGMVGYNWTLNTGGVVTRVIRGGVADEEPDGYACKERTSSTLLLDDVVAVNRRERDGESDIFTAVLGKEVVDFIIRLDSNNHVIAEPLERTNVKIECEFTFPARSINGWIITDGNGIRYFYREKEWTRNVFNDEGISFNGIRSRNYISSWFLSRIEPRDSEPVDYYYHNTEKVVTTHFESFHSKYIYGRHMTEKPFDFGKYRGEFVNEIQRAASCIEMNLQELQRIDNLEIGLTDNTGWVRRSIFENKMQILEANYKVLGEIANFRNITEVSGELVELLDDYINYCSNQSTSSMREAKSCFIQAKQKVIQCLNEVNEYVIERETYGGTTYSIQSPRLEKITCGDKMVSFDYLYNPSWKRTSLAGIKLQTISGNSISEFQFQQGRDEYLLGKILILSKDGEIVKKQSFDYHESRVEKAADLWGYYREVNPHYPGEEYNWNVDTDCSKHLSLQCITLENGGKMFLDYESNYIPDRDYLPQSLPLKENLPYNPELLRKYGGIRVKSIVFSDRKSECSDTIKYHYPLPGNLVYYEMNNQETINYGGFSDKVIHSKAKNYGAAFKNTGNNGLYYNYVEEEFVGQGVKSYFSFHRFVIFIRI